MDTMKTALILGATGGIGGEMARQLRDTGWRVRAVTRRGPAAWDDGSGRIEWVAGDALRAADVQAAAQGCGVIVHAVNPPGYRGWAQTVLPMLDHTLAAARAQGATVVLPGTVYNYGPETFPLVDETAPQRPLTRKGAIRVAMEQRLQDAAQAGEVRSIVVRAGDFFGPHAGNNWFAQGMVRPGRPVTRVNLLAAPGVGHQFAYLPDVARTMVALLARRETLPAFATFHMGGHWDADGTTLGRAVQRAVVRRGGKLPALRPFAWWLVTAASPFVTTMREIREMRYLWQQELRLDNRRLAACLGTEPHTPLDEAVETTLHALGCLPDVPKAARRRLAWGR